MTGEKIGSNKSVREQLFKINDVTYSFKIIKIRSKFAPMREIDLLRVRDKKPVGIPEIDSSEIRVCKIGKTYHLITGYQKLNEAITNSPNGTKEPCLMSVKVMAESYLATAKLDCPVVASVNNDVNTNTTVNDKPNVPKKPFKEHKKKDVEVNVAPAQRVDNSVMKAQFESAGFKVR